MSFFNWIFGSLNCKIGDHEFVAETVELKSTVLYRLVCIQCGKVSDGWELPKTNGYGE